MPNRIIKDSFQTSDKIASLTDFEFRLWVSLIVSVDDAGRGDARPAIIKGHAFPLRERITAKDINDALHGLAAKGCVSLYEVDGKPYFWFPTWTDHQRVRECKPKYPAPPENSEFAPSAASCRNSPQLAASCRKLRPESNPNTNTNTNPNPNTTKTPLTPQGGRVEVPEAIAESWNGFCEMREKIKKPLTDRAAKMILNELERLAPEDITTQGLILDQSVKRCWQDVYPLKTPDNTSVDAPSFDLDEAKRQMEANLRG